MSTMDEKYYDPYYFFQHKLLPGLFFTRTEEFINELSEKGRELLYSLACKILVGSDPELTVPFTPQEFDACIIEYNDRYSVCKLTFPEPYTVPFCYFAYLIFDADYSYMRYFTAEKSYDYGEGDTCFLCGWNAEGSHLNYGQCEPDEESVLAQVIRICFSTEIN